MKMRATDKEGRHSQLTAFSSCSFDHGVETPDLLRKLTAGPVDENQSLQRIRVARGSSDSVKPGGIMEPGRIMKTGRN